MKTLENISKRRGKFPVILSQIVNPGIESCGWCGWTPPQDDILGALAYCTQEGLACPSCRASEWNGLEPYLATDMLEDAYYRSGGDPSIAYQYALSWARHTKEAITLRGLAKRMLRLKQSEVEKKERPAPSIYKDGEKFTTWKDPRIWFLHKNKKYEGAILIERGFNFWQKVCQKLVINPRQPLINGEEVRRGEIFLDPESFFRVMVEKNPYGGWNANVWISENELKDITPIYLIREDNLIKF
jgi:hypothetical protein